MTRYRKRSKAAAAHQGTALPPGLTTASANDAEERPVFVPPIAPVAAASRAVAHNFAVLDPDGPWRRYVPFVRNQGRAIPSLAVATAAVALGIDQSQARVDDRGVSVGSRLLPLAASAVRDPTGSPRTARRLLIDYRSRRPDGSSPYRRVSFYKLFYSEQQLLEGQAPIERPEALRDKIVVVGATAAALDDVFTVPVTAGKVGGLEVHAAVVDAILSGRTLSPVSASRAVALTIAAGVMLGVIGAFVGPWITTVVALALWGAITTFATWQFARAIGTRSWCRCWHWCWRPSAIWPTSTSSRAARSGGSSDSSRAMCRRTSTNSSSRIRRRASGRSTASHDGALLRHPRLHDGVREGEPEAIVAQLNEYFSRMVPIVFAHKGTIDKFVGDMIMALFGAPLDDPDHADHAVETALAMSAGLASSTASGPRRADRRSISASASTPATWWPATSAPKTS